MEEASQEPEENLKFFREVPFFLEGTEEEVLYYLEGAEKMLSFLEKQAKIFHDKVLQQLFKDLEAVKAKWEKLAKWSFQLRMMNFGIRWFISRLLKEAPAQQEKISKLAERSSKVNKTISEVEETYFLEICLEGAL